MFDIKEYTNLDKDIWNQFVLHSRNGTFLFDRDYMDYHADRFYDCSLMIYRKDKLYALLPANSVDDVVFTHQGLTYGGFVLSNNVTTLDFFGMFKQVCDFYWERKKTRLIYKPIPYIYHQIPSQEELYALFRYQAKLIACNISSTIYQNNKIKFIESRKSGIRKARNARVTFHESDDFKAFWQILDSNLMNRYSTRPVHTLEEIVLLHSRFPHNIKLYLAYKDENPVGGTIIYETKQVIHTQYISTSNVGKECGALDILFDYLINEKYQRYPIFDFGQSTEQMGNFLNESLIFQKEGFGGRGVTYETFELNIYPLK